MPEGVFCGARCREAYRASQARLAAADRADEPPRPLFSFREKLVFGLLMGVAANMAINDLARRQVSDEDPGVATEAMQALKTRAMDQVRAHGKIGNRLLGHFAAQGERGKRLTGFSWSATRVGGAGYRVRVGFREDGRYRAFTWVADLTEQTVIPADAETKTVAGE